MDERNAYIALNMMDKVGPVSVRALSEALGSAAAILDADDDALCAAKGVGRETASAITGQRGEVDPGAELDRAAAAGARILTQIDAEYPQALLQIHDPPLALYIWGGLQSRDCSGIAVVGTRRPTHYGRGVARRLASGLGRVGITVISGLAEGIDTEAHRGALEAGGRTVAVLGGALDCFYPVSNRKLAEDISSRGAVLSEFPFGRQPDKTTFPMRNRIVSGLAKGVVVVEAGLQSGALITAREAMEQGRTVFAVPGRIDTPAARGTHALIKDGAALVTDVEDILNELELLFPVSAASGTAARPAASLSDREAGLVSILEEGERDVDSLIRASGLGAREVNSLLIHLEMKKVIRMLPGRMVEVVHP